MDMILTGHGEFAVGLADGLFLIAGQQEGFECILFRPEQPIEEYREQLRLAMHQSSGEEVIVFTDLLGGTPFQTASALSLECDKNVRVVSGTNLGMLLEATILRLSSENLDELVDKVLESGKMHMTAFKNEIKQNHHLGEGGDGI